MDNWKARAESTARGIRKRVLDHTIRHRGGYMSQACSSAEILATMIVKVMHLAEVAEPLMPLPFTGVPSRQNREYRTGSCFNGPHLPDKDRFYLSPAHYALCWYVALIEAGRMAEEGLLQFNRDGSSVEMIGAEHSPGMEFMTGSLGQGISQAAGIALARRRRGESGRSWIFMSDGEFQIGQTWEALQAMSYYRLDTVGIYVDVNKQQCDGHMESVMNINPLDERLSAFGARVITVDGHDVEALAAAGAYRNDGRPLVVLAYTDPCRGLELLRARAPRLHYLRFNSDAEMERYAKILAEME